MSLRLKCISYLQQKDRFCFCIQSVSLCLLKGELSSPSIRDTKQQWLLSPVNLVLFLVMSLCVFFSSLGICCCENINSLCFCWCNQLRCVGVLLLVLSIGLALWLGIGYIWFCHWIFCFVILWWLKAMEGIVIWVGIHVLLMSA